MVAMNSIPQQDVANGRGQSEFFRANPTTLFNVVAKKPSPEWPGGISARAILFFGSAGIGVILNLTGRAIKNIFENQYHVIVHVQMPIYSYYSYYSIVIVGSSRYITIQQLF
jgi:hypothetical protein